MIRAVLDANVVLSAFLGFEREESKPGAVLRHAAAGRYRPVISDHIMAEVGRGLDSPFFRVRIERDEVVLLLRLLDEVSEYAPVAGLVRGVCPDPDDDAGVETALSGHARYIVTGDKPFMAVGRHAGIEIVGIAEFLAMLEGRL